MTEQNLLSDIVVYNKYAKYITDLKRRETWKEIVDRYVGMMIKKYVGTAGYNAWLLDRPDDCDHPLFTEIISNSEYLYNKDVLMSMRAAQFAGPAIEKNEARIYNCGYLPIDDVRSFSELMFLLLGGTGDGYSIQFKDVAQLPEILKPNKERKYLIGDSIEGWADAIKALVKAYFGETRIKPRFDFSDIRPKGSRLVTAGGKAPGPEPLRRCLLELELILDRKNNGERLSTLDCHDMCCHIADAVLAGGIRRAALIALFSADDEAMRTCKHGNWWELNPQRGRANNSAVFVRGRANKAFFDDFWQQVKDSRAGEPGIYWTNDPSYGTNPCCEISLRPFTFCNLTEINAGNLFDYADKVRPYDDYPSGGFMKEARDQFYLRCQVAAFFGTLQAGFTDFHYLREKWKTSTEKDALIGVGMTGICNGDVLMLHKHYPDILKKGAQIVKEENERVAKLIGISKAARTTTIKPSGTTSCVVGTSSGIHAWHSQYYIRNMQCAVGDDLYNYFSINHPELIKIMDYDPKSAVIGIPMKAPDYAILREDETAISMMERVMLFNKEWVREGHRSGPNTNNVSATVSITEGKEWDDVNEYMWKNRNIYNGLSVLPYDGGTYKDAPFQECTEEEYNEKIKYIQENPIKLTDIIEDYDNTDLKGEVACAGGSCELTY